MAIRTSPSFGAASPFAGERMTAVMRAALTAGSKTHFGICLIIGVITR
jgi:hypothetical protein